MKILLLQTRDKGDPARLDEIHSFAQKAGIGREQIITHNLLAGPPDIKLVQSYEALMIGGSGDYDVSRANLPDFQRLLDFFVEVVDCGHPTFASCFGFQLMVKALGGDVIFDAKAKEVGTFSLKLTEAGRTDELFRILPTHFYAQLGHKDRAACLPENVVNLAASDLCPYQAFRVPDKPIWATQFHPELNYLENKKRFLQYSHAYSVNMSKEEYQQTLDRFHESKETQRLIRGFIELIS